MKRDRLDLVWPDWNEIDGSDNELVAIDAKVLKTFCTSVDEAQEMRFARGELELGESRVWRTFTAVSDSSAVVGHFSVNKVIVRNSGTKNLCSLITVSVCSE